MEELFTKVILPAIIAAVVGYVSAAFKNALDARSRIDEEIRKSRIELYQDLWKITGALPKWPRATGITHERLTELSNEFRVWYFDKGGLYLAADARKAYGAVQDEIAKVVSKPSTIEEDYEKVRLKCSALRTELTNDLLSRRRALLV